MKRNKAILLVSFFTIALFALGLLTVPVHAYTFPKSNKVAMVPYSSSNNGGSLYTGSSWPLGDSFTFTNLSPSTIADGTVADPIVAGGYDTVVLMSMDFNFATYYADADFSSRILSFVNGGGKLIIYTSETPTKNLFANFIYPFTVDTPGQTGNLGGTLTNLADDTLSSSNTADASYIDLSKIVSQTDAVGDLTVMTSYDSHWYIDMFGINTYGVGGPGHTYAFYGAGLIIFNGLNTDYASASPSNANGGAAIGMVWWRELCEQTLGPGQSVNGLTLTPATATNTVGTTHTVTATVRTLTTNQPVPGVVVTFTITSGPNAGLTGQATTDTNGEATFSWSSTVPGTDTIEASIPNVPGAVPPTIVSTATKDWLVAQYYLTVKTDPSGLATIPGEGWYNAGAKPTLTAPQFMTTPFLYWDVDGARVGNTVNPITVTMDANHTATAHYYVPGVGGEWAPIQTVQLVTPWVALAFIGIAIAAAGSHRLLKKRL